MSVTRAGAARQSVSISPLARCRLGRWGGGRCGPGQDYPAGEEPDAEKRALEEQHCDPTIREPFIAALSQR